VVLLRKIQRLVGVLTLNGVVELMLMAFKHPSNCEKAIKRTENSLQGMTQTIVIDVRDQTPTPQIEANIRLGIVQKSGGVIDATSIRFNQ
jgi:hypothetical protein